jgi:uncharacterized protein (DUF1800 family)
MLIYLNNQQNIKGNPNENFAREIMELFTLGLNNGYNESDVKEAARTFTGWKVDKYGQFKFNKNQHDFENKNILGHSGKINGKKMIDILLNHPSTPKYLALKLVRYFVNENGNKTLELIIERKLIETDYDISKTLYALFSSIHFYDKQNIGNKIKSPIELIVGIHKNIDM